VGQAGTFVVLTPGKGTLVVKVVGPKSEAKVEVKKGSNGQYDVRTDLSWPSFLKGLCEQVSYNPTEPGSYAVHVTLDGEHIPGTESSSIVRPAAHSLAVLVAGSIFRVYVLEQESLGGEGKVRVFFSTTSSTEKGRQDFFALERLMTGKEIHLRPDFEPWVPVDVLDKAGTCRVGECRAVRVCALPVPAVAL
jgi:hypothetical protein